MKDFSIEMRERIDQLALFAGESGKQSVLFIEFCTTPGSLEARALMNRETSQNLLGFCEISNLAEMREVLEYAEGRVAIVALDMDKKIPGIDGAYDTARAMLKKTRLYIYSDHEAWCKALCSLTCELHPPIAPKSVLLVGGGNLTYKLALALAERSYSVAIHAPSDERLRETVSVLNRIKHRFEQNEIVVFDAAKKSSQFDILIGTEVKAASVEPPLLSFLKPGGILIDGGIGSLTQETVRAALQNGIRAYRLDNRAAISAVVVNLLETSDLVKNRMGRDVIAGVALVAGGVLGEAGDIIVDSISDPHLVIGIADGAGRVVDAARTTEESERLEKIKNLIGFRC